MNIDFHQVVKTTEQSTNQLELNMVPYRLLANQYIHNNLPAIIEKKLFNYEKLNNLKFMLF